MLQAEREEAERARERERRREDRRDDARLMAAAIREPTFVPVEAVDLRCPEDLDASFLSTTSTASTLVLVNENFVHDEVSC